MEKLSKVSSNKLMKVACYRGMNASHNEQEEAQRKRKIMNNYGHNKGSEVSHRRLSDGEFDRVSCD